MQRNLASRGRAKNDPLLFRKTDGYSLSMSVTVIKEGNTLRVIEVHGEMPADQPFTLFTADELRAMSGEHRAMLELQAPAFIRGDEDETAEDLFKIK